MFEDEKNFYWFKNLNFQVQNNFVEKISAVAETTNVS